MGTFFLHLHAPQLHSAVPCNCIAVQHLSWLGSGRLGKKWSPRRWTQAKFSTIEATSLLVALALWLGPNMMVLLSRCSWFNPAVPVVEFVIGVCWANIFVCTVVRGRLCLVFIQLPAPLAAVAMRCRPEVHGAGPGAHTARSFLQQGQPYSEAEAATEMVGTGVQMRARCNNLWVNKRGEALGDRPDSICADGPFLRMQWMNILLWLAFVAAEALVFASWHG